MPVWPYGNSSDFPAKRSHKLKWHIHAWLISTIMC
jgi:hypothetical protein